MCLGNRAESAYLSHCRLSMCDGGSCQGHRGINCWWVAPVHRSGGSQNPDRWLKELRNNQAAAIDTLLPRFISTRRSSRTVLLTLSSIFTFYTLTTQTSTLRPVFTTNKSRKFSSLLYILGLYHTPAVYRTLFLCRLSNLPYYDREPITYAIAPGLYVSIMRTKGGA